LPSERFGSASAIHKRFLQWEQAGFFQALWRARLAEYEQLAGIAWRWQSIDEATIKAPPAQQAADPNPDRSGKNGGKRHVLAGGRGVPLSRIVSAANVNDCMRLSAVFQAIQVKRPNPTHRRSKHLCADASYRETKHWQTIGAHSCPCCRWRQRGQAKRRNPNKKAGHFGCGGLPQLEIIQHDRRTA
jgi:hypothetical protein